MIKLIPVVLSGSYLPKTGRFPGKLLIASQDHPEWPTYWPFEITVKPRSYPISIDEGTL